MKLFLIAGYAKSGKNYFADILKKELEKTGKRVCLLRITAPLYEYAKNYFSWDGNEDNKPRDVLQKLGIEHIKNKLHKDYFLLNRLTEDIEVLDEFFDIGIITDGRLESEFTYLKEKFKDIKIIRLDRDNFDNKLTQSQKNHITEKDLDNYLNYDYKLKNIDSYQLQTEALRIIEKENII